MNGDIYPAYIGTNVKYSPDGVYVAKYTPVGGVSLLDYFAAKAPITYQNALDYLDAFGGGRVGPWNPDRVIDVLVELRCKYADAMLKARQQ